jgi:phosphoribosylaminoimidazolecarboxamide formyltransferase / IMP cyclohydrolase
MEDKIKIKSALVSVFHKNGLETILQLLNNQNVEVYSTGGTETFITSLGYKVNRVEDLTSYPSILGGRVKTLHPKVFGGILNRSNNATDQEELKQYEIPNFDLVIVDLYPFEATVSSGAPHEQIIEKIDIGGISLIRAAAKNYADSLIVPSKSEYSFLQEILENGGESTLAQRKALSAKSFMVSSNYDTAIFNYFNQTENNTVFKASLHESKSLRYGENPHQKGTFYGNLNLVFDQLHGKEISYNNLLDIDAAVSVIADFNSKPTIAILKHNNACGLAERDSLTDAWNDALAGDPISAFGGIIISNQTIDEAAAAEMDKIFFEVVLAPGFTNEALAILQKKKNRIILKTKAFTSDSKQFKSLLNGVIEQDKDLVTETNENLKTVTNLAPSASQINDLLFANKLVKHTKSNAIVLAKNGQLLASGTGQTSRVDALNQAIEKAKNFGFNLEGAVMASDAFFPFPDCVEIAKNVGITSVIQPGGSIKDQESIDYCNNNGMSMIITGLRHFKH